MLYCEVAEHGYFISQLTVLGKAVLHLLGNWVLYDLISIEFISRLLF